MALTGRFGRKINTQRRMAAGYKPKPKKSLVKVVKGIVSKAAETKYVSQLAISDKAVSNTLTTTAGGNLVKAMPTLAEGTADFQRVGAKVNNVRGACHFQFWIDKDQSTTCENLRVKIFMLSSRQIRAYSQLSSLPGSNLLDNGDGSTTDWSVGIPGAPLHYALQRLTKESWRGKTKTISLIKNIGNPNGPATNVVQPNTYGKVLVTYTWRWKHKGNLQYTSLASDNYPTNFAPLFGVVGYTADSSTDLPVNSIFYNMRTEMFYKDA